MHLPTHIMSGWCVANVLPTSPRQRVLCMIAATAADLDGLGILVSQGAYWDWHHKLGHNVFIGALLAIVLTAIPQPRRVLAFILYLALFHLHLVLDYFGSGMDWGIWYLWPASDRQIKYADAWPFYSLRNVGFALLLLVWTIVIIYRHRRTPLEALMPNLDRQLVAKFHLEPTTAAVIETPMNSADTTLMLAFLRDRDVDCPACGYNLRNLTVPRCPECGHELKFTLGMGEPYLAAWITLFASIGAFAGFGLVIAIYTFGVGSSSWEWSVQNATFAYYMLCVPAAALTIGFRRRFIRLPRRRQWTIAIMAAIVSALSLVAPHWF